MKKNHNRILENEILDAFILLFDPECSVSLEAVRSIKPMEIKIAYRRKALQTHPDRAQAIGKKESDLTALFTRVTTAYEKLCEHSKDDWCAIKDIKPSRYAGGIFSYKNETKPKASNIKEEKRQESKNEYSFRYKQEQRTSYTQNNFSNNQNQKNRTTSFNQQKSSNNDNRSTGDGARQQASGMGSGTTCRFKWGIPNNELLLGQYLYYSGIITWEDLIKAIIWQRSQRPKFGQIAQTWNILTKDEVNMILKEKKFKDKIGEYAVNKGYINSYEQLAIMGKQKRMQFPIGQYFVDKGKLSAEELHIVVEQHRQHNKKARNLKKAV